MRKEGGVLAKEFCGFVNNWQRNLLPEEKAYSGLLKKCFQRKPTVFYSEKILITSSSLKCTKRQKMRFSGV